MGIAGVGGVGSGVTMPASACGRLDCRIDSVSGLTCSVTILTQNTRADSTEKLRGLNEEEPCGGQCLDSCVRTEVRPGISEWSARAAPTRKPERRVPSERLHDSRP